MRKYLGLAIVILMLLTFTACFANNSSEDEELELTSSAMEEMTANTTLREINTGEATEIVTATSKAEQTRVSVTESAALATQPSTPTAATTPPSTRAAQATTATKTQRSTPPTTTTTQAPVTTTLKAVTTTTTTKTQPTEVAFDINYWVDYAKNYALSLGMIVSEEAKGSWDTPLSARPNLKNTEKHIKSRISKYQRVGYDTIWVWAEQEQPGSQYFNLYVGYG